MPQGIEGLNPKQAEQVRTGNALAEVAAVLIKASHAAGNLFQLEQPARSLMVEYEPVTSVLKVTGALGYQCDACADGAPWSKPFILQTPTRSVGLRMAANGREVPRIPGAHTPPWKGTGWH